MEEETKIFDTYQLNMEGKTRKVTPAQARAMRAYYYKNRKRIKEYKKIWWLKKKAKLKEEANSLT